MKFEDISVPEIYKESWDFRFFLKWIWTCLAKVKYDTEHVIDNYDPLKCKKELLWLLGDTVGFKYDDRLPTSFNRLVILYFMDMIRRKGSKSGVTFAAEVNLAQFDLISYINGYIDEDGNKVEGKEILSNRLENVSVPVNAVYVAPHTREGYIEVVYFSEEKPIDACIEYVRPLGMYIFQHAGVRFDSRTQISIDARLTHITEIGESLGPTHVADYTRGDYASMQKVDDVPEGYEYTASGLHVTPTEERNPVWYRNSTFEQTTSGNINPGYRALYSLQLCNNEHVVKSLIDPMFSLGFGPQKQSDVYSDEPYYIKEDGVTVVNPRSYLKPEYKDKPVYNLRYDRDLELSITTNVTTLDEDNDPGTKLKPIPAVNPIMSTIGDAIAIDDVKFSETSDSENIHVEYLGNDEEN